MAVFLGKEFVIRRLLLLILLLSIISGCGDLGPENPYTPDPAEDEDGVTGLWQDVLASDPNYPQNVYLTENISFNPGKIGRARITDNSPYYTTDGYPKDSTKNGACGPPEGTPAINSSEGDMTVLGSGGWAVWSFDPGWVIVNGEGDDFMTFSNHNLLYGDPDGSWNELAHVYVSEDGINWYISSKEDYTDHPVPGTANEGYFWTAVTDLHGNNHSWANFRKNIEAEAFDEKSGVYEAVVYPNGSQEWVSMYFTPDDQYLGGDRFDLTDFIHAEPSGELNGRSWPAGGRMRYLKLVDDPSILDGQDWNPDWMTGARIMSAMGINVETVE